MRIWLFATAPVIAVLFVARLVGARRKAAGREEGRAASPEAAGEAPRHHLPDMHVGAQPAISEDPA